MLVVKVELWPGGHRRDASEVGWIGIANISELASVSDYIVVRHDDASTTAAALIAGHRRADGFWPLLARAAQLNARDEEALKSVPGWAVLVVAIEHRIHDHARGPRRLRTRRSVARSARPHRTPLRPA